MKPKLGKLHYVKTLKKSISKFHFPVKLYEIRQNIIHYKKIYKFQSSHFFTRCIFFILILQNMEKRKKR